MVLFDEQNKLLTEEQVEALKKEIANELDTMDDLTEDEAEKALGDYYTHALKLDLQPYNLLAEIKTISGQAQFSLITLGGSRLEKIRKIICGILTNTSTVDEIIEAILDAIASIIPGGIVIKKFLKKVIKYIISLGIDKLCPAT